MNSLKRDENIPLWLNGLYCCIKEMNSLKRDENLLNHSMAPFISSSIKEMNSLGGDKNYNGIQLQINTLLEINLERGQNVIENFKIKTYFVIMKIY